MRESNKDKAYLLGVDIGSSKTHALIADLAGHALGFGAAGCGNYEVVGVEGFMSALQESIQQALHSANVNKKDIGGLGLGISGYDWPSERSIMISAIDSLGLDAKYDFVNDALIGLIAGSSTGWGIGVDAGTGNNVMGRDKSGKIGRITGNSIRCGEFGGAGEMVWRASVAVIYAWTQRGPKTQMTQLFMDAANVSSEEALIEGLAMDQIQLSPLLAKQIFQLASLGDGVALDVVNFTARELAFNVNAVIRQLNFEKLSFEVVMFGSIFKAGEIYLRPFEQTVLDFATGAKFVQLHVPPVVGAVLLGAEASNLYEPTLRKNLVESTKKLLTKTSLPQHDEG